MSSFKLFITAVVFSFGMALVLAQGFDSNVVEERAMAKKLADDFAGVVESRGYLSPDDYRSIDKSISSLGNFTLEMEYQKKRYQPVYSDPNDANSFTGTYSVIFDVFSTDDLLDIMFPGSGDASDSSNRKVSMLKGDLFYVRVVEKETKINAFRKAIGIPQMSKLFYTVGGLVINEGP